MNVPAEQASPYAPEGEISAIIRIPVMTLRRWRREARGPPFRKLGGRVLYNKAEVLAWVESQRRVSTSDAGAQAAA